VSVTFPLPIGSDFTFTLDPLTHPIDPKMSSHEILYAKLSLKLSKSSRGTKWPTLELPEGTLPAPTAGSITTTATITSTGTPSIVAKEFAYPTSSRTGAKNWDAIEREIVKEAEEWEKPEGDAAANALFRDLFRNATPEVRKAMEKSYVESNGTALSTNWEEVSKGRVDTKPPDSMVAKKWGE
jgi:suppressor of G2 allele of SKP1